MDDRRVLTGKHFMNGDEACAEGALAAGCSFFGGYPITPSTEIAEHLARRMPEIGAVFIQMEDELASMAAVVGAAWTGSKSMTVTSGPGFSLMMENIGLGAMMETPCVVVNVQRGGPSTGLPTMVGQGDVMQARWGSHGDYELISLSPQSPQEAFDLTIDAFNLSEKYRLPVMFLMDECVGHMTEKVVIPKPETIEVTPRILTDKPPGEFQPYRRENGNPAPEFARAGDGYRFHTTGLTHDERGYPTMTVACQQEAVGHLVGKVRDNVDDIVRYDEEATADAEVVVLAFGITARVARMGIEMARKEGVKVGFIRPIVIWPFPEARVRELAPRVKAFVVPEINLGQIVLEVERCVAGKTAAIGVPHPGGGVHDPKVIHEAIMGAVR